VGPFNLVVIISKKVSFLVTELWLGEAGYGAEMYQVSEV